MCKKLYVLWIAVILLLAGCTPAAEQTGNSAALNTTDRPAQTTEEIGQTETTDEETTSMKETFPTEEFTVDPLRDPPTTYPVSPTSSAYPSADPPADLEAPWGTYRSWMEIESLYVIGDPNFVPDFSEGGTPDRFVTTSYDAMDCVFSFTNHCAVGLDDNSFLAANMLDGLRFPIECARKIDDDRCYVVYKVRQGGYFYLFFQKLQTYLASSPVYIMTGTSYVYKSLSYQDMASVLTLGTSIAEAEALDPSWGCYKLAKDDYNSDFLVRDVILRDGLLSVYYKRAENGEFVVQDSEFYADFKVPREEFVIDYTILESDYPQ